MIMPDCQNLEAAHLGDPLSAPAHDDEDNTVTIQCHRCQRLITRPAREPHWDGMCACGRSVFEPFQEDEQHLAVQYQGDNTEDQDDDVEDEPLVVRDLLETADIFVELARLSARMDAIDRRLDKLDEGQKALGREWKSLHYDVRSERDERQEDVEQLTEQVRSVAREVREHGSIIRGIIHDLSKEH